MRRRNAKVLCGWEIRVWSDADNEALLQKHFPQHIEVYRALPFGVMRADVARLVYMHALGGWYSDTDYEWLRLPAFEPRVVLPMSRENRVGNAVFGSVAGHPFWAIAVERLFAQPGLHEATRDTIEVLTGPEFVTTLSADAKSHPDVWLAPRELFHSPVVSAGSQAYGVHHTAGTWRANRLKWRVAGMKRRLVRSLKRFGYH